MTEASPLQGEHIDAPCLGLLPCRVADDVDETIESVEPPKKIVVFAIGTRQERREMPERCAFQAVSSIEPHERVRIIRTDAVDQYFTKLIDAERTHYRKGQHVPERKSEIIDQHLSARCRVPFASIQPCQQTVEIAGRALKIDIDSKSMDQLVELVAVPINKCIGIGCNVLNLADGRLTWKNLTCKRPDISTVIFGVAAKSYRIEFDGTNHA